MNTKRKAELQRKLSMASVPKPPADLASRIKRDIPASIGVARPAWYGTPALRIAASLVVVVACAILAVRILSRAPESGAHDAISMGSKAAKDLAAPKTEPMAAKQTVPANEPAASSPAPAKPAPAPREAEASPAPTFAPEANAERRTQADRVASANQPEEPPVEPMRVAAAPAPPPVSRNEVQDLAKAQPPAAAAAAPAAQAAAKRAPEYITVTAAAPPVLEHKTERALQASKPAAEGGVEAGIGGGVSGAIITQPKSVSRDAVIALPPMAVTHSLAPSMFGLSTDPAAMEVVRTAVQEGEEPSTVDIEAIVNYFAAKADEPPRTMTLQIEGSPPPVLATPRTRIVRITIDTPHGDDASVAATDAFLSISFDPATVVAHRLIGGTPRLTPSQRIVLKNTSVTALYEIQLRSGARPRQKVVSARLTYRDGTSGKVISIPNTLQVRDIDRAWLDASYRHRLATLGAIWGESLKNAHGDGEVARRAEELARQDPQDRKAKELAELASASSRRRSSGSTGSGR